MRNLKILVIAALLLSLVATSRAASWDGTWNSASAKYIIYSGGLGDMIPPEGNRKKIAIEIAGAAAKDIFNSIGPDIADICGSGDGMRIRKKNDGALSCSRSVKGEYYCNIGFDLKTGKSIAGVIC